MKKLVTKQITTIHESYLVKHLDYNNQIEMTLRGRRTWMLPKEFKEWHSCMRSCYQYIHMRIKLYFAYEDVETAIKLTF